MGLTILISPKCYTAYWLHGHYALTFNILRIRFVHGWGVAPQGTERNVTVLMTRL